MLHARAGDDPERVQQFVSEARAASALNHPNIVTVFDAAIDGDRPFIVQEVIEEARSGTNCVEGRCRSSGHSTSSRKLPMG